MAARCEEEREVGGARGSELYRGEGRREAWRRERRRPGGARRPWRHGGVPERDSSSGRRGAALLGGVVTWPGLAGPAQSAESIFKKNIFQKSINRNKPPK